MQEELRTVLAHFREKRRTLDILKTPEIYIQQTSTAKEVEQWLRAKGFSEKVIKKMKGLNGNELFALKRTTLEDYCGHDEGKRLASQLIIQRNVSGVSLSRPCFFTFKLSATKSLILLFLLYFFVKFI